tara:strand:+ start:746 stop:919 length:174 start_codon:yes stop_codon:yes gene_type:complete
MVEAGIVRAVSYGHVCPHCGAMNGGFLSDPRGTGEEFECEFCEKTFIVAGSAKIELS